MIQWQREKADLGRCCYRDGLLDRSATVDVCFNHCFRNLNMSSGFSFNCTLNVDPVTSINWSLRLRLRFCLCFHLFLSKLVGHDKMNAS